MTSGRGGAREGAGRPAMPKEEKAKLISIKVPPDLLRVIDEVAKIEGQNRTEWLLEAAKARLTEYL